MMWSKRGTPDGARTRVVGVDAVLAAGGAVERAEVDASAELDAVATVAGRERAP
jgi:hypothetical protein